MVEMVEDADPSQGRGTDKTDWGSPNPASYNPACTEEPSSTALACWASIKALPSIKNALEAEELKM